jgi:hypothetical protein
LTWGETTSSFLLVLKRRKLILSLVLLFSLAMTLNVFAHCLLEHDITPSEGADVSGFVSCPDVETGPFFRSHHPRYEKDSLARMQRQVIGDSRVADLKGAAAIAFLTPPRPVLVNFSVPIYQLQTNYRI